MNGAIALSLLRRRTPTRSSSTTRIGVSHHQRFSFRNRSMEVEPLWRGWSRRLERPACAGKPAALLDASCGTGDAGGPRESAMSRRPTLLASLLLAGAAFAGSPAVDPIIGTYEVKGPETIKLK